MNPTQHQDLVVGKIYEDLDPTEPHKLEKTVLEYMGEESGTIFFKYHSGNARTYTRNSDGLFGFTKDGIASFWESPNSTTPCS